MTYVTNNYSLTNRCPDPTTTDCVQYVGIPIPCLGICTGDSLTSTQCAIANNLCILLADVNMSTVVIPECFTIAWGTTNPTILNFLNFILEQACLQQQLTQGIIDGSVTLTGVNPIITVNYPPCCANTCNPGATLTVSQHLDNILICLCNIQNLLGTLPTGYNSFGCALNTLNSNINTLFNLLTGQAAAINSIVNTFNASVCSNGNVLTGVPIPPSPSFNC